MARSRDLVLDPFKEGGRSEGNRKGWKEMSAEERKQWGREMQRRRTEKEAERKEEQLRVEAISKATLTVEQWKEEFLNPASVIAWERLWAKALATNDVSLFRWVVEHRIGKPGSKQEIEHSGGVTINIVRPPRGDVIDGELVAESE